ncbi:transmembrane protein 64-like [Telopea speciosissima]|uniref:transmembrane protein 64-like n=1 Tax=Telopea speciosissima TaxID=54955 RepID=UPI001CC739BB|nr:transmembrane protein 64-like [Telopea speciosissima]XP_043717334.1 transmembrane protein 64-like [Telopea speciosissima]
MTCKSDDTVVSELKMQMGDEKGDYVTLGPFNDSELGEFQEEPPCPKQGRSLCWWVKVLSLCICLAGLAVVVIVWVGPIVMNKVVIPSLNWERNTFSMPVLVVILFASVALFPAFLVPSAPSMWVAGMTFGYGYGFLLIMAALTVGVSLPYFIGSCFQHKINRWLERWPKRAAFIRLAGEGNWFHQFRAVTLLRISPFPYILFNYAVVATNVKYCPYILGSLVGMVPDVIVAIYSGILLGTLAEATQEHRSLTAQQAILNVIGFCFTVATTVVSTVYAKRKLNGLKEEEELVLE